MESAFQRPLDHVRFHEGPPAGSVAAAQGDRVALGPEVRQSGLLSDLILAHEIAHTLHDWGSDLANERGADEAAVRALAGMDTRELGASGTRGGLVLRRCSQSSRAERARSMLNNFESLTPAAQEAMVHRYYTPGSFGGQIREALDALAPEERTGRYRDTIRRIMELVERREVRAATGMTDEQMAQAQATFMDAEAQAAAAAAAAATGTAPTAADTQAAHQQTVAAAGLPARPLDRWSALPVADQPAFRHRAGVAVSRIVFRAAAVAPELHINVGHLHFSPETIDMATDTRFAEYDSGNKRLNFGMDFRMALGPRGVPDKRRYATERNLRHRGAEGGACAATGRPGVSVSGAAPERASAGA